MSKEIKREVKTFIITLECDCGGKMKSTGICLTSNPPQWPHKCDKCGKEEIIRGEHYPKTTYQYQPEPSEE